MARRRPIFICPISNAASVPRRADAAQYRTASEPCSSSSPIGVTTLPLDFDIFLRSGSRIQPLIAADDHGSEPCSRCERTTVENSQVRMMSWPWGRRSMGNTRLNRSGSVRQPPTICGVSELVAQVSMMSGSADEAAGDAALVGGVAGGHVGRRVDRAAGPRSAAAACRAAARRPASSGYQTGNGTPKKRCRETSQSPLRPLTQFS